MTVQLRYLRTRIKLAMTLGLVLTASTISPIARPLQAQVLGPGESSPYTDLSTYLLGGQDRSSGAGGSASSTIFQNGQSNNATVDTQGLENTTAQWQRGVDNSSSLTISGDQNTVGTSQIGNHDSATISVTGQSNTIIDSQIGNNLSFTFQQVGDGKTVTIRQVGQGK